MDGVQLADTIFRIGVGVGALLVGIGVVLAVLALRPVLRDTRALARDARRLVRMAEVELPRLMAEEEPGAAQLPGAAEVAALATAALPVEAVAREGEPTGEGRQAIGPVQSPDTREDEWIA
jgi:hypothetical protein